MGCKITRRVVEREITEEEFVLQKKLPEFDELRHVGKTLNFLMVFGGSARVFSEGSLETFLSPEEIDVYIRDNKLQGLYDKLLDRYQRESPTKVAYMTAATHMRDGFFKLYTGLWDRIDRNREFAKENGYVRSRFGATRKIVEMMLGGEYDQKERSLMMNNLRNIAANTDIQNLEAVVINVAMVKLDKWLEETGKKSRIFNMVHDSCDIYVHKSELKEVFDKLYEYFEHDHPELEGLPIYIDTQVSDLSKGDCYKHGRDIRNFI